MRAVYTLVSFMLVASGCGGDDDVANEDIILLDNTSDEVVLTLADLLDRNEAIVDDEIAAVLTSPESGSELPADSPPTLTWSLRQSTLRHGRDTGEYVWVRVEGPGMDAPIDVAAIESTSWTPEGEAWELLRASTGPCEVQVVSAYVERGVVMDGPFLPSSNPTFSVTE